MRIKTFLLLLFLSIAISDAETARERSSFLSVRPIPPHLMLEKYDADKDRALDSSELKMMYKNEKQALER